ncbi:MAG: hypothetical protein ACXW1A_05430 [Nitrososphaeraceae archaeon]
MLNSFSKEEREKLKTCWEAGHDAIDTETGNRLIKEVEDFITIKEDLIKLIKNSEEQIDKKMMEKQDMNMWYVNISVVYCKLKNGILNLLDKK